jgi:hypothetical protein
MNAETAAAWAAWVAAAITAGSAVVAVRANRHSKDSVAEARRSADAAEVSAKEASRSADASVRSADAAERQAVAAEAMVPPEPPKVAWRATRATAAIWMLMNVGSEAARNVDVTVPGWDTDLVEQDGGALVRPGGRLQVRAPEVDEMPPLVEFHVTWDGQSEPVVVPIPGG